MITIRTSHRHDLVAASSVEFLCPNGLRVSIINGTIAYCDVEKRELVKHTYENEVISATPNAEVAIIGDDFWYIPNESGTDLVPVEFETEVLCNQTVEQIAKILTLAVNHVL